MALRIISADERLSRPRKINMALVGPSGAGKTFSARTLDPTTTLFIDLEAGTLALDGEVKMPDGSVLPPWGGDVIDVRKEAAALGVHPWMFARALACLLCGPDPAVPPDNPYSRTAYEQYTAAIGDPAVLFGKYTTLFWDSITVASRMAFSWAQMQPQAMTAQGKPDTRGAYGLLGQEMVTWLTQIQHIPEKSTIVAGILDTIEDKDIPGRVTFDMQIEGSKAGRELPGIFDQVVTLGLFVHDANTNTVKLDTKKGTQRAFVCHQANGFGVPAKDRSGRLDLLEPPDLGALLRKISSGPRRDTAILGMPQV